MAGLFWCDKSVLITRNYYTMGVGTESPLLCTHAQIQRKTMLEFVAFKLRKTIGVILRLEWNTSCILYVNTLKSQGDDIYQSMVQLKFAKYFVEEIIK